MVGILPRAKQQPAGLIACGLRAAALFSSAPSSRKKGTSLSRCLLLAEMVGILPRAKQQPAGLIACGLRAAALFSSAPSSRKKGTSLSRCLLLAEMVGFEPTCPVKDKTISSL